jgi:hypothetical protein
MKTIRRLTGFYFDPLLLHFHQGTFLSPVDLDEAAGDAHISRGRRWFPPPIFFRWPFRGLPCLSRVFSGRTLRGLSRLSRGFSGCTLLGPSRLSRGFSGCTLLGPSRLSRVYRDALCGACPVCQLRDQGDRAPKYNHPPQISSGTVVFNVGLFGDRDPSPKRSVGGVSRSKAKGGPGLALRRRVGPHGFCGSIDRSQSSPPIDLQKTTRKQP